MKKFIECFKKYFSIFAIWTVLACVLVSWEFNILTATKEEEKVDILVNANNLDEEAFKVILDESKPEYLKEVNYRYNVADNDMYGQVMQTYGSIEADLFIISNEVLDEAEYFNQYFYKLDETMCKELIGSDIEFYKNKYDETYGIVLNSDFLQEEGKTFYLLFSKNSLHLGRLNNQELDGAIVIAKALLGK